jgi:hypothetical protein
VSHTPSAVTVAKRVGTLGNGLSICHARSDLTEHEIVVVGDVSAQLADILAESVARAQAGLRRIDPGDVENKAAQDRQITADHNDRTTITEKLRATNPDWRIKGDEFGALHDGDPDAPIAVIDPIDVTTHCAWGIPRLGMVISVAQEGEIVADAVMDPIMGDVHRRHTALLKQTRRAVSRSLQPSKIVWSRRLLPLPARQAGQAVRSRLSEAYDIMKFIEFSDMA